MRTLSITFEYSVATFGYCDIAIASDAKHLQALMWIT